MIAERIAEALGNIVKAKWPRLTVINYSANALHNHYTANNHNHIEPANSHYS